MLIAANWKMYKGPRATREFLYEFDTQSGIDIVIAPPFASLAAAVEAGSTVYAQNVHWAEEGAFTGEVSASMLIELGVAGAIVGHSERRQLFGETDETAALRAEAALAAGLRVIACVGETETEREAGETEAVLRRQVRVLPQSERLVIAYEPVWAIGTGEVASPADAQEMCQAIRERVSAVHGPETAASVRILYGGSVKSDNIAPIMAQPSVDGALVGGASLDAGEFAQICRYRELAVGTQ